MIRLRPLRPREKRSIRHWAIELAVVVVGVLLALWAAEWAEDRSVRKADALTEEAVRRELFRNIGTLANWQALGACHEEQIRHMRDLLLKNDGNWPGIGRRAIYAEPDDADRAIPGFYMLWAQRTDTPVWDAAVESGAVDRWDLETRRHYSQANQQFKRYVESMDQAHEARKRLGALVFPGRLSDADRFDALNQLIILDGAREYIGRPRENLRIRLTSEEIESYDAKFFPGSEEMVRSDGPVRPCFKGLSLPYIVVREEDEG